MNMHTRWRKAARGLGRFVALGGVVDLAGVGGFGMLFAGLWWLFPPSALIVCGAMLAFVAYQAAGRQR